MGNICTSTQSNKPSIECPHRKHAVKNKRRPLIQSEIDSNYVCLLCKELREINIKNQEARLDRPSQVSLTSHSSSSIVESIGPIRTKISKSTRKTINDFQVVRGLGKGAFGKVYLIRQREESELPNHDKDILSLRQGHYQDDEYQIAEELTVQDKFNSNSEIRLGEGKQLKDTILSSHKKQAPKNFSSKISQKNPESGSKLISSPRYYALKIINKNEVNSEHGIKHAMSERNILQSLDHPFVVKLYCAFQTKSRLFLIVDLLPGGELFYLLRKLRKFTEQMARFYAAEILLALEYLHKKSIIYRDLKPQNILLDAQGHIRLTDFGLSKILYSANQKTYSLCGTPQYIAPQVIIGGGYTQAADWFSFGSLLYDMLTGRPPFLNTNKNTMLKNLVSIQVPLPNTLSQQARSLLTLLFKIRPEERIGFREGAQEIKKHPFFDGVNWSGLLQKSVQAPVSFHEELKYETNEVYLNSNGFQKWSSWHINMQSPVRKTQESKQHFEGFTYEQADVEIYEYDEDETPGQP